MMQKTPLVSVLMPAFNAGRWIEESIASLIEQSYDRWELIVVDDGSHDGTDDIVSKFAARDERVRIERQDNAGAASARNRAFALSRGELIQYLDADDLLSPSKLALQVRALYGGDGWVASCPYAFVDESTGSKTSASDRLVGIEDPIKWLTGKLALGSMCQPIHGWLTPRSVHQAAGVWDERLTLNDDGEFFSRVLLNAVHVVNVPQAVVYYRVGDASSLSRDLSRQAVESQLLSYELCEQQLLKSRDTPETRAACRQMYLGFLHDHYPRHTDLMEQAEGRVRAMGFRRLGVCGGRRFRGLGRCVGLRNALWLRDVIRRNLGFRRPGATDGGGA